MVSAMIILAPVVSAKVLEFVGGPLLGWLAVYAIAYPLLLVTGAIGMFGGVLPALPLLVMALLAIKPLAFIADIAMDVPGGNLKRRERFSPGLSDVLGRLYIGSYLLRFFHAKGQREDEMVSMRWAMDNCLHEIGIAFDGFIRNLDMRPVAALVRVLAFPTVNPYGPVSDRDNAVLAGAKLEQTDFRERISHLIYRRTELDDPRAQMEHTFQLCL